MRVSSENQKIKPFPSPPFKKEKQLPRDIRPTGRNYTKTKRQVQILEKHLHAKRFGIVKNTGAIKNIMLI